MKNGNGIRVSLTLLLATNLAISQQHLRVVDCLGTQVLKDADSTVYSDIKYWMDTAQDTAHFLGLWGGCNPPLTCNPIFLKNPIYINCHPDSECTFSWIFARIGAYLVNDKISTSERNKIYDTLAADLNASFNLKELHPTFIEDSVPVTVDSSNHYFLGQYPWLTKGDILALSKKCYINKIGFPMQPVVNRGSHPIIINPKGGKAFNGKGQKMGEAKSGVYYLKPKP